MTESKKKIDLPFKIVKSEVTGGYIDSVHSAYTGGIDVVNYHEEKYSHFDNNPLQSPFTETHVGGRQHRHVEVGSIERPEAFHVDFVPTGVRFYSHKHNNSPPSYWSRDNIAKSSVNLKNIQTTTSSLYVGNYSHNYEVVQTSGRRITNNLIVDGFEASGVLTTKFIYGEGQYTLPELNFVTGSKSIIVERFSAPGGKEESSRGSLDREGEEYSPNSPLPFRNIKMRKPFYSQLSQSTPQGGGSIHGVNRNRLVRAGNELVDNGYVVRPIPSTDIQYSWVTASSITTAAELGGYQSYGGDSAGDVFTDISFISGSFVKSGSNTQYLVDNLFINSLVKDYKTIDLETNTFYIMKQTKIEQDFLLFSNGETLLSDVELLGDGTSEVRTETSSAKKYFVLNKTSGTRFLQLKRQFYGLANIICTIKKSTSGTYDSAGLKLERADSGEDLLLQYSFDGNTWITAKTILAGASSINSLVLETEFKKDLPYYLRFAQLRHSGNNFDNYAITDLEITQREPAQEGAASYSEFINSPYTYTTWTSLRNSEGPVSKALRANNIISVQAEPKEGIIESKISGKRIFLKPKRAIESVNYTDPPVTFKYKPLKHRFVFVGTTNPDVGQEMIHTYTNNLSTFANKELIKRLSLREEKQQFYNLIYDYYTRGDEIENNPIERFLGYNYTETVWPREQNTGLNETRKRAAYYLDRAGFDRDGYDRQLGTQRVFWRDSQEDRKRSKLSEGGYYSSMNYLSTEESGSSFYSTRQGYLSDNKLAIFTSSLDIDVNIDSGIFNSIKMLETLSPERTLFTFSGSAERQEVLLDVFSKKEILNSINKRGYVYDISGEWNNCFIDFYEELRSVGQEFKSSLGTLYRNSAYKSLLTSLPQEINLYTDTATVIDSEEIFINPKLKYLSFIGGGELNTGSFFQDPNNFTILDYSGANFFKKNIFAGSVTTIAEPAIVYSIGIFNNTLYCAGSFTFAKSSRLVLNCIASIDLTNKKSYWSTLGEGVMVSNFDTYIYSSVISGSDIYVGGNFTTAGGSPAFRIAKWDTTTNTWSALGNGLNNTVYSIATSGSDIYAGGLFTTAGGSSANRIAKWDTTTNTWSALGSGLNTTARSIAISGSDIYVGGDFTTAGGSSANRIAKWDTTTNTWSALGSGLNGIVYSIATSGSDIYVGGDFTTAGGSPADRIAKWDTTTNTWSALGSGVDSLVYSIAISGSDIYVGGFFTTAGGSSANRIAKWDTTTNTWSALGSGVNKPVYSIAISGSDIYVGGNFTTAGEISTTCITKWNIASEKWEGIAGESTEYKRFSNEYFLQTFINSDFSFSTLDNGFQRVTEIDSGKKPFFDSYSEYVEDIRTLVKDKSTIPEFNISNNIEFYVKEKGKNFRALNNKFLFLDGQEKYKSSNDISKYDKQFLNSYATSDLIKKLDNIVEENKNVSSLEKIGIKVSGVKKLLPYNGFYPEQRSVQIANLYSEYIDNSLHGGVYNLNQKNNSIQKIVSTDVSIVPNTISSCKFKNKYYFSFSHGFASLNGPELRDIIVSGSDIYVGGNFTTAGGSPAFRIAKWDTTTKTWSALSSGVNSLVYSIATSGSDIYAGGLFSTAGGSSANRIAKWDTTTNTWSALGSGLNSSVYSIATSGSDIYAGGLFTTAGGSPADRIAKWDTTTNTWSALGSGLNTTARSIAISGSDIYVGGDFTTAGGSSANRIAKWDTTTNTWSALGSGLNGIVYSIATSGSDIYVGGSFTTAGGSSANCIAKWDTTTNTWSALGSGVNSLVYSIAISGSDIYAGGPFSIAGGSTAFRIAKWDTTTNTWSALSSGVINNSVFSIAISGSDIYLGGNFTTADNEYIPFFTKYIPSTQTFFPVLREETQLYISEENEHTIFATASNNVTSFKGYNSRMDCTEEQILLTTVKQEVDKFYIYYSTTSDGEIWTIPEKIVEYNTTDYITGSIAYDSASFSYNYDILLDNNKAILAIGSYLHSSSNGPASGEIFIVTGSYEDNEWKWSDKQNIFYGESSLNRAGTGVSLISCSSGYQLAFSELYGDNPITDIGNIWVCTSSNGGIDNWSIPIYVASGSNVSSNAGFNNIKMINFQNKSYIFFSEPTAEIDLAINSGGVFVVSSSNDNSWGNVSFYAEKNTLHSGFFYSKFLGFENVSTNIAAVNENDERLVYCFTYKSDTAKISEAYIGDTTNGLTWKKISAEQNDMLVLPLSQSSGTSVDGLLYEKDNLKLAAFYTNYYDSFTEQHYPYVMSNNVFTEFSLKVSGSEKYYKHAALEPIMSPGILYNTIKSGIAVDWPCATGSNTAIVPYGGVTAVNAYYPQPLEMASYQGSNIRETMYGHLRSNIDYRIPFENILFPNEAFTSKDYLSSDLSSISYTTNLPDDDVVVQFIKDAYIYGGYEPYISPFDFSDINSLGPKRFSVPFVYRKNNSQDTGLYTLAMSNFLAETVKFFLKDEKMVTFTSEPDYKWKNFNANKTYYIDVVLEKSPDLVMMEAYHSDKHPLGPNGEKMNGRYFGYPVNKTDKAVWGGAEFTEDEARLIHNDPAYAPYTPPYFEGEARVRLSFTPNNSRQYSLQEVFDGLEVENIFLDVAKGATTGSDAYLNKMPVGSSVDLFGTAQSVEITVDETTGQKTVREMPDSQTWILSPKMETPVLDFSSQALVPYENNYSKTSGFGRGMWSGYGQIPQSGSGVKIRLEYPFITNTSPLTASLLEQVGFKAEERNVGQLAETKLIKEAIVLIPYLETINVENKNIITKNGTGFNFIKIDKKKFSKQRENIEQGLPAVPKDTEKGVKRDILRTSISEMITKMKDYVIPPEMNFLEYSDINPFVMYIFEFEHTLDQQDLADIWQGLMPKISYTAEEQEVSITHKNGEHEFFEGNGLPDNLRWLVFKVKKKAEYNYFNVTATTKDDDRFNFNKIIGRKEGTDIYSYNWPYDYFSLVEFAKVELSLDYIAKEEEETEQ